MNVDQLNTWYEKEIKLLEQDLDKNFITQEQFYKYVRELNAEYSELEFTTFKY